MRHAVVARGISQRRVSPGLGDSLMRVVSLLAASCPPGGRIAPASCPPPPPSRFRELPPVGPRRPCVGSSRLLIWKWAESPGENGEWESSGGECGTEEVASGSPDAATRLFKWPSRRVFPQVLRALIALIRPRCRALARCRNTIREAISRKHRGPRGLHAFREGTARAAQLAPSAVTTSAVGG